MKRKRKPQNKKEFILYENSFLLTLNRKQRRQLNRKKPIIYPPIQFIENVRHGVNKRRTFFEFTNTVNIPHWSVILKMDLLENSQDHKGNVLKTTPINSIFDEPEAERIKMETKARLVAERMDAEADYIKRLTPIFHQDKDPILELCEKLEDIEDHELLREYNQAFRKKSIMNQRHFTPTVAARNDKKKITEIRKELKEYKAFGRTETLTKAAEVVEEEFFEWLEPLELISKLSDLKIISAADNELKQISDRYRNENSPNLDVFAPYAAKAIRLYLTLDLFLMENSQNTLSREVLRDYDYLYYVLPNNVTFVSADKAHRKFIDEIPVLKNVRQRFLYFDKRSEDGMKGVLKKLGIEDLSIPKVQ